MIVERARVLKKTDNISIRIDSDLRNKLHDKCTEQKISLNTLINHLLEKQVNWNELTDELGWVSMFRTTFRELMEQPPIEKIQEIAKKTAESDLKNSLNYFYGYVTVESILELFKKRCQSMNIKFRVIPINGNDKIVIQHDLGKNWPHFIIAQMNTILNGIGYRVVNDEYNRQGFSFEIAKAGET